MTTKQKTKTTSTTNDVVKQDAAAAQEADIYLKQEIGLTNFLITFLENSKGLSDSVEAAIQAKGKKERLTADLAQFKNDKLEIEGRIEDLKKNFGSSDSLKDIAELKKLNIDLDSVITGVSLLEKQLHSDSEVVRNVGDFKNSVAHQIHLAMDGVKERLQSEMDKKADDIILTFEMYHRAFSRVEELQKIMPKDLLQMRVFRLLLPNISVLGPLAEDTDVSVMASVMRGRNQLNQTKL